MSFPGFQPSDESNRLNRVASLDWRKVRPQANSRFEFFLSVRDLPFPAPKDKTINVGKRATQRVQCSGDGRWNVEEKVVSTVWKTMVSMVVAVASITQLSGLRM